MEKVVKKTPSKRPIKTDEEMTMEYAQDFITKARAVFHKVIEPIPLEGEEPIIKAPALPDDWTHFGLVPEELALIDPSLVIWGYWEDDYIDITNTDVYGNTITAKSLNPEAVLSPVGIQYDRLSVLMLKVMQADRQRLDAIELRLNSLGA